MLYDVIIVGSGPAGLSAAIYAERSVLNTLVLEVQPMSGGQILNAHIVDNYPGLPGIGGFELGMTLRQHAEAVGTTFQEVEVKSIKKTREGFRIVADKEDINAKTVIIATGAVHRKLEVPGEDEFVGNGISYCATCDGAFFKDKVVAVAGGGDVALGDALILSHVCKKVYLIHRRDELRGAKILQEQVLAQKNVEFLMSRRIEAIEGEGHVEKIDVYQIKEDKHAKLAVDGVFVAVGNIPLSGCVDGIVDLDKNGYIIANEDCKTSAEGVFAAGDVRTKQLRQVITAVADGANAITSVEAYLYRQ